MDARNFTHNNSDLKESNFLRRMNQSKSISEIQSTSPHVFDNLIICKQEVKSDDCAMSPFSCSKVKLKLEKQPKFDQKFMRRATNRRALKSQRRYTEQVTEMSKDSTIEYIESCEVW